MRDNMQRKDTDGHSDNGHSDVQMVTSNCLHCHSPGRAVSCPSKMGALDNATGQPVLMLQAVNCP